MPKPRPEMRAFCILKTPYDIVFNTVSDYGYNLGRSLLKYRFCKCGRISGPKRSPDMICIAFRVKFHDTTNGIPPKACRPPTRQKTNKQTMCRIWTQQVNKNNVQDMGPQKGQETNVQDMPPKK